MTRIVKVMLDLTGNFQGLLAGPAWQVMSRNWPAKENAPR